MRIDQERLLAVVLAFPVNRYVKISLSGEEANMLISAPV